MKEHYNIYCDESCHLENDHQPIMLLGAVWGPTSIVQDISKKIRKIKKKYHAMGELKWTKVSNSKIQFYIDLINFFFSTQNLNFRCIIIQNKHKLNHSYFNQGSHDSFYYKMYFYLLRNITDIDGIFRIFIDIKDTRSQLKIEKLKEVLCNNKYDFDHSTIELIQHIRSHESEIMQLCDFLMGAIAYKNREFTTSKAKLAIVNEIQQKTGLDLTNSTPPWENKFNLFFFSPQEV
jgi:hypothetical protein